MSRSLTCILKYIGHCTSRPLTFCYLSNKRLCRSYGTSIYVNEKHMRRYFEFDHGLDKRLEDIDSLEKLSYRRACKIDLHLLKKNYNEICRLHKEKAELEVMRVENSKEFQKFFVHKKGKSEQLQMPKDEIEKAKKALIAKGKELKNRVKVVQDELWNLEGIVMEQALSLPNDLLPRQTEKEEVIESYLKGEELHTDRSHLDMVTSTGDVVFSNVGQRAYYLKGRLALLEQVLIQKFSTELRQRDLNCILAPEIFTTPIVESGCLDVTDPGAVNRLDIKHIDPTVELDWQLDNMFLYGASHLSFLAYFSRMVIDSKTPNSQWFVVGRHYMASEDDKLPGLLGVLQSVKVCMCSVNTEEADCLVAMETFIGILVDLYKQFNIPYRVISMPVDSLAAMECNRIELQMWVPSLNKYLKIASVSYCGDYSSRRLMIRSSEQAKLEMTKPVFMVHGEVTDLTRLIAILIENGKIDRYFQ